MPIPANVIVMMPSGSVPSGWSAVSEMNSKFAKGTTSGFGTGGSSTHTHGGGSHTHSAGNHGHGEATSGNTSNFTGNEGPGSGSGQIPGRTHYHRSTPSNATPPATSSHSNSWDTDNHEPSYYNFLYIKSDGTPEGLPPNCVALYHSNSAPTGWTAHSASQGKFARGNSSGGGTGGGSTAHTHVEGGGNHTHTAGAHSHSGSASSSSNGAGYWGEKAGTSANSHLHSATSFSSAGGYTTGTNNSGTSSSTTPEPSYRKVAGYLNNSGADQDTVGIICMWLESVGSIPDAYNLCDGNNGTPSMSGRFLRMASGDNNGTGGDTSHSHSAPGGSSHTHSTSSHTHPYVTAGSYSGQCTEVGYGSGVTCGHTHSSSTSASATATLSTTSSAGLGSANHEPAYRYIAYIQQAEKVSASFVPTVTMFDD